MKTRIAYGPFRRILFCTDFSENADVAFAAAVEQARHRDAVQFCLFHVVPEPEAQFWKTYLYEVDDVDGKGRRDMDDKIELSYRRFLPEGLDMQVEIQVGTAEDRILEYSKKMRADLIVIGRQGRSSFGKMLFGNVTEKVVRKAECAVLVVPMSFGRPPFVEE